MRKETNTNEFESNHHETKPQTAVAGKKHTITTDMNKIIHQKLVRKPLPNSIQHPLSRREGGTEEGQMKDLAQHHSCQ